MACAACLVLAPSAAAERFAHPMGDNSAAMTCPIEDPCDINTAIEDASVMAGETITILPGDYPLSGSQTLDPAANPVTIRAQPGEARPRIVVDANGINVQPGDVLRGLYVECTSNSHAVSANGSTLEQMVIHATHPCDRGVSVSNGGVIRDSVVTTGFNGASGDAVRAYSGAILSNVTAIGLGTLSDGFTAEPTTAAITLRNVIARGQDAGIRVEDDVDPDDLDVFVYGSNYSSVVEAEPEADFIDLGGNQTAAPLFVNPDPLVRDFHQLAGSPTVDAGASFMGISALDVDGQARVMGCAPDIGADELTRNCGTVTGVPGTPAAPATPAKKCKKKKKKKRAAAAKKCKRKKKK
jgi:hypothetical protein